MNSRILIALALIGLLAGCDQTTVVTPGLQVQVVTDATTYSRTTGEVRPTLVNASDRPVYLFGCSQSTTLEVSEAGGWKDLGAWYPTCLDAGAGRLSLPAFPSPVDPGTYATLPHLSADDMARLESGTYRMRVLAYSNNQPPYTLLPEEQRVTEPFQIVD